MTRSGHAVVYLPHMTEFTTAEVVQAFRRSLDGRQLALGAEQSQFRSSSSCPRQTSRSALRTSRRSSKSCVPSPARRAHADRRSAGPASRRDPGSVSRDEESREPPTSGQGDRAGGGRKGELVRIPSSAERGADPAGRAQAFKALNKRFVDPSKPARACRYCSHVRAYLNCELGGARTPALRRRA